ncbi:MAG: helix-turn-helix domain-containing protein [Gammaproteobacteria bacterium]|nr:helix-turn-helix domain-containing protein [Gammaproteobacteria bacterium]
MKKRDNPHYGQDFDDFLNDEGLLSDAEAVAIKRVLAFQLEELMRCLSLTKTDMAKKMHTSRASLNRLLDPENTSVTLHTLTKAADVVGRKLHMSLSE